MTNDASALLDFVSGISPAKPTELKSAAKDITPVPVEKKPKTSVQPVKKEEETAPEVKEMMRTSIFIDKKTYKKFKTFSSEVDIPITALLTAAIEDMLETGKLPKSLNK